MRKAVFSSDTERHRKKFIQHCMRLLSSTLLNMASQEFIVGHYGGFDRLAASAVKEAKRFYPEVKLTLLLPYHPAERPIPTPNGFDGTFYPPGMEGVPRKVAIVRANRYVVDHVDYLIAYAWHPASNARELVEYARKRQRNLCFSITLIKPDN